MVYRISKHRSNFPLLLPFQVIFEGVEGGNPLASIAIDDIHFLDGACIPKGDCDFESGTLCSYENAKNNTRNWVLTPASIISDIPVAPKVDHTTGLTSGM